MNKLYPVLIILIMAGVTGHYFFGPKEVFIRHKCNIQKEGVCTIEQEGIKLTLELSPKPIIPTEDVTYKLNLSGVTAEKVTVQLLGHDMAMPQVEKDEQLFDLKSFMSKTSFQATRVFPTCTEKLMIWRLYLIIKGENKWVRTNFDLQVKRRS